MAYCQSSYQQGRTYLRVWDNRMEMNFPLAPFGCFTCNEMCVVDMITTIYYDRQPFRSGMCCFCIPITICGPPVIFAVKPANLLCINCSDWYGQSINSAPCNFFGLRQFICFGTPCYTKCAIPITGGLKDADAFLGKMKTAVDQYAKDNNLGANQMATFDIVTDGLMLDSKEKVTAQ